MASSITDVYRRNDLQHSCRGGGEGTAGISATHLAAMDRKRAASTELNRSSADKRRYELWPKLFHENVQCHSSGFQRNRVMYFITVSLVPVLQDDERNDRRLICSEKKLISVHSDEKNVDQLSS
ncbi:unnamed protein product [Anisakis simplex]|uniref:Uncharacterized protein n=1 Tax=Anisakis simplex TaxID=6269 RepID=A0A0M3JE58_ANISI|nr:unnamed protein product [Anisakis simplex]